MEEQEKLRLIAGAIGLDIGRWQSNAVAFCRTDNDHLWNPYRRTHDAMELANHYCMVIDMNYNGMVAVGSPKFPMDTVWVYDENGKIDDMATLRASICDIALKEIQ